MTKPKRYTVTAALPYANGPIHIGQVAGAYLPADIYVRYLRMKGEDVIFICGSDEHGAAITIQAKKEGVSPESIVDKYHQINKTSFENFGVDFDIFHRTSSELHHEMAAAFFTDLYEKGVFEEKETEQYYDEEYKQFLADRYIVGTCPKCGNENAYGDQCEKCGTTLSPTDLINPRSMLSGKDPVLKRTKHWYLPLNNYEDWLRSWIIDGEGRKEEWKKNVAGQCRSWLDDRLQPRSITRDLDWGVKVPLPDTEGKVLYVWLDAPIGYISATKQWGIDSGKDWQPYWKDEGTKLVHFLGKDNIVFHCIIFPVILKAKGNYILPTNVPANEFMNLQGKKISTSRNWAVWLHEYLQDFPGKQDVLRYCLCANMPETKDSEFTWEDFQSRNNSELVGVLGNYVNRTIVLTHKFFDGQVPAFDYANLNEEDEALLDSIKEAKERVEQSLEKYRFKEALNEMMNLARAGNKYLTDTEPWKLIKTDEEAVKKILHLNLQVIANLSKLMEPFLPNAAARLAEMLGLNELSWQDIGKENILSEGHQIGKAELLFEKIEDETVQLQIDKLKSGGETQTTSSYEPVKEEITFEDFVKLDIRSGRIEAAQRVEKADKLLQLTVDLGFEKRTIVSGIAEHFLPEEVVGKQVSVVVNLAPRKLRGILSQGMVLMAEDKDGNLQFVSSPDDMPAGSVIR